MNINDINNNQEPTDGLIMDLRIPISTAKELITLFPPPSGNTDVLMACNEALAPYIARWQALKYGGILPTVSSSELIITFSSPIDDSSLIVLPGFAVRGLESGNPLGASLLLRFAMSLYPDDAELWFTQGEILTEADLFHDAKAWLDGWLAREDNIPEDQILFISNDGAYDRAERAINLTAVLIKQGRISSAMWWIDQTRDFTTENITENNMGVCRFLRGEYALACQHFQRAAVLLSGDVHIIEMVIAYLNWTWVAARETGYSGMRCVLDDLLAKAPEVISDDECKPLFALGYHWATLAKSGSMPASFTVEDGSPILLVPVSSSPLTLTVN